jgi:hypothetical protein
MAATSHGIQVVERERVEPAGASGTGTGSPATTPTDTGEAVPALGVGTLGVLTLLVGAWGGIVPFVGPLFGFSGDGTMAWYWNLPHALLWLAPGAVACAAGLVMLGALPRAMAGFGRIGVFGAGLVAALCGAWFVVGPEAWPVMVRSAGVFAPGGAMHAFVRQIGYSFGPGVLLLAFGALAMGIAGRRPRRVRAARPAPAGRPIMTGRPVTA